MPSAFVQKISKTSGLGVLKDCPPPPVVPLRRYNLIYGFNATGKTTLSRVFASLQAGAMHPKLPLGASFEVELSDGTKIKSSGDLGAISSRILVFNGDFQEENLRWKDGTASPVFYIGKEQAELAAKLEAVEVEKDKKTIDLRVLEEKCRGAETAQITFKRDTARLIAEQLGLGRKYDATKLSADYGTLGATASQLSDAEVESLKQVIAQQEPLPKIDPLTISKIELAKLIDESRGLMQATLGQIALADLSGHDGMFGWIRSGLTYHADHALTDCLFCGNTLSQARKDALALAIDNRFDKMVADILRLQGGCESISRQVQALLARLPSPNDISPESRANFDLHAKALRLAVAAIPGLTTALSDALVEKKTHPNQALNLAANINADAAAQFELDIETAVAEINKSFISHNHIFDEFKDRKSEAGDKLKNHYLVSARAEHQAKEADVVQAKSECDGLRTIVANLNAESIELNKKIRAHGPAASAITAMIHSYLGHKEFEIVAVDSGYQLVRNGVVVKGSLSEGEKTAISLCYFLSTLSAEGRAKKDLIVVIDDPISSLDTRALNYAFSIIKSALGEPCQLVLLTHNVNFMNEAKKWLRNRADANKGEPTASLLFLDTVKLGGGSRASVLMDLPKYIRDYESEYHYLFHLVLKFSKATAEEREAYFVMPNALRKVLDVFLAFKRPGADGLSSKVDSIPAQELGLDPARILALDRLIQLESHADNLDDLVAFSSMSVEETVAATEALLELMEKFDPEHFKRISKICAQ